MIPKELLPPLSIELLRTSEAITGVIIQVKIGIKARLVAKIKP